MILAMTVVTASVTPFSTISSINVGLARHAGRMNRDGQLGVCDTVHARREHENACGSASRSIWNARGQSCFADDIRNLHCRQNRAARRPEIHFDRSRRFEGSKTTTGNGPRRRALMRPLMTIDRSFSVVNVAAVAGDASHVVASAAARHAYFMICVRFPGLR